MKKRSHFSGSKFTLANFALIVCSVWSLAASAAQISVPNVAAKDGGSVTAEVQFEGQGNPIAGLEFDLEFDVALNLTATIGPSGSDAGKSVIVSGPTSHTTRFLVIGMNQNALADGVLLILNISTPAGAGDKQYPLHVSNAVATDPDGNAAWLSSVDGTVTVGAPPPVILSVVNSGSFLSGMVDGSWISIQGTSLSATTRAWQPNDIVDANLPTSLDGVGVTIDGLAAAISYVSPTQLNVQVPATGKTGPVSLAVTNSFGTATSVAAVFRNSPGLFCLASAGGKYPAALIVRGDGGIDYLGPSGLFAGALATRPARPGEILVLYATGLGPTDPAVVSGQVVTGAAPIIDPIAVSIGAVSVPVAFAGLVEAGLFQINVPVPDLPAGDQPLVVTVNGVPSQTGVFVPIIQ